jgi:ribonuclease P protein component
MLRLRSATDFERVRRDGRSYAHPLVVLVAARSPQAQAKARVGFAAGRSVGTAVKRNRAKRLLREAFRSLAAGVAPEWDLICIARAPIVERKMPEVRAALAQLLEQAHVLNPPHR